MVERGLATLHSRMQTMIVHEGLNEKLKTGLIVNQHEEKSAHKKLYGKVPDYIKYLKL